MLKCPGCGGELVKLKRDKGRYECKSSACSVIEVRVVGRSYPKEVVVLRDTVMSAVRRHPHEKETHFVKGVSTRGRRR
jgi:hypothetical protein